MELLYVRGDKMRKLTMSLFILLLSTYTFGEGVVRTISVTGSGQLSVKPDTVVINTGVNSGNPVIAVALDENNKLMNAIFKGLNELGISEDDIKTSNYNVRYHQPYKKNSTEVAEYKVSNSIKINIKNLELIDIALNTLIELGANKIDGINFTFRNKEQYKNKLTVMALRDAREKAEFLAKQENMKITGIVSITEEGSRDFSSNYNLGILKAENNAGISAGSQTISTSYNIVYQIEPK